jgi:hypothetical protein
MAKRDKAYFQHHRGSSVLGLEPCRIICNISHAWVVGPLIRQMLPVHPLALKDTGFRNSGNTDYRETYFVHVSFIDLSGS